MSLNARIYQITSAVNTLSGAVAAMDVAQSGYMNEMSGQQSTMITYLSGIWASNQLQEA